MGIQDSGRKLFKLFFRSTGCNHSYERSLHVLAYLNRNLLDLARTMIINSELNKEVQTEDVNLATYALNTTSIIEPLGGTLFEVMTGRRPYLGRVLSYSVPELGTRNIHRIRDIRTDTNGPLFNEEIELPVSPEETESTDYSEPPKEGEGEREQLSPNTDETNDRSHRRLFRSPLCESATKNQPKRRPRKCSNG